MRRSLVVAIGGLGVALFAAVGIIPEADGPAPGRSPRPDPEIPVLTELGGDVHIIYDHQVRFAQDPGPQQLLRSIKEEAAKARARMLIVDIEDYQWVNENIDVVRRATREIKREGRLVGWYMWPHRDDSLTHDYSGVDVIFVPGHTKRTREVAVERAIDLAVKHDKPLVVQYGHRLFDEKARWITPAELGTHVEWLKQIHQELLGRGAPGLMVFLWSSDHNALARREGTPQFRSEPRWKEAAVIEFAEHVEDLLNDRPREAKLGVVVTAPLVRGAYEDGEFSDERLIAVCRTYRLLGRPVSIVTSEFASMQDLDARIDGAISGQ